MNFRNRCRLAWSILKHSDRGSNLQAHAERELLAKLPDDPEPSGFDMNAAMRRDVLDLIFVFATQGHSGFSATFALAYFAHLAKFEPLSPLTGADDEWNEVAPGTWQNKRCSHVFKQAGTGAYDLNGYVFEEPDGARFTGTGSSKPIAFPYTPGGDPIVVKVDHDGVPILKKYRQLREPK